MLTTCTYCGGSHNAHRFKEGFKYVCNVDYLKIIPVITEEGGNDGKEKDETKD